MLFPKALLVTDGPCKGICLIKGGVSEQLICKQTGETK